MDGASAAKRATNPADAIALAARRSVICLVKARARAYERQPGQLEALHPGLSLCRPDALIALARHLVECGSALAPRRLGFGGEVGLVNARAALLIGRVQRRRAARRQEPIGKARVCSATPGGGSAMTAGLQVGEGYDAACGCAVSTVAARLVATRRHSLDLASPLSAEDQVVQANDDASPTKWHLAHVTWFFETFLLKPRLPGYTPFDERFPFCFNSYYEAEGARQPRGHRGLMTRPSRDEVLAYRAHVDAGLRQLCAGPLDVETEELLAIGINHEQQHQELLLTDVLSLFASQPLRPAYADPPAPPIGAATAPLTFTGYEGGIVEIGHPGRQPGQDAAAGFSFDNEGPRHRALLQDFRIADRLVTNGEWLDFVADGGYLAPALWLADGWAKVKAEGWDAPLYWERRDGDWFRMSLRGRRPLDPAAPVAHVSFYEADAFARWAGRRLPTEFEWEYAAGTESVRDADGSLDPVAPSTGDRQFFGQLWQWTASAYLPYPGYRAAPGALGEYNGKFMCSQHVLRGSSCATPPGHARLSYRNFFYPWQRWQFTGLRLADDR